MSTHRADAPPPPVASAVGPAAATFPAAELDRRFYAFVIDRTVAWTLAALAGLVVYRLSGPERSVAVAITVLVVSALLVGLAVAAVQGLKGFSPGKALLGLRVVHLGSGSPLGLSAGLLRSLVLALSTLPTFGIGLATLAWTAVMDRDRQRRGWHDHLTESIVVDVRPVPAEEVEVDPGPRHVVNLTAMRLVPAASRPARHVSPAPRETPTGTVPGGYAATPAMPATPAAPDAPAVPSADAQVLRAPLGPAAGPAEPAGPAVPEVERTTVRSGLPATTRWRVSFDTGEAFVVEGPVLVGRRPEPRTGEQVRHLVALPSQDMSLSKTHAQLQVAPDGALVVMDRGSTNGSVVVRQGAARQLEAARPTALVPDDVVRFGDRSMTVSREP